MRFVEVNLHVARMLIEGWLAELETMNKFKDGRPFKYSKGLIEFAAALKDILRVSYRSLCNILKALLPAENVPHFITLQQRIAKLEPEDRRLSVKNPLNVYNRKRTHIVYDRKGLRMLKRSPRFNREDFVSLRILIKPNAKRPMIKDIQRI
ncbi:MAG: hypothetical protein GXO29_01990 [Thermotogae bacterium]|nr:hypothetical protein [Thermotogota bacterium]